MILVMTNHPYLRVGRHRWYQSYYENNTSCMVLFSKITVSLRLDAYIRTILVLKGGKLTGIYFLHLLYVIYFLVITHLRPGKKVSILSLDDVNPGPVLLR
jgi:hypothetical protein